MSLRDWLVGLALATTLIACSVAPGPGRGGAARDGGIRGGAQAPVTRSAQVGERELRMPGPIGERTATVFHPPSAGPHAPLVVVLHALDGSAADIRQKVGLDRLARRDGFVVAYPEAVNGRWNAGLCCRDQGMLPVDDVAYLHELRERLVIDDQVDPLRVYVMGMSNGGMLAYAWACDRPGDLSAIGVVAATLATGCTELSPVTVVAVHGAADTVVPIRGGVARGQHIRSLDDTLLPFREAAACPANPTTEQIGRASVATWRCADGRSIVRTVIAGTKHTWPGRRGVAEDGTDPWDATDFILRRMSAAS